MKNCSRSFKQNWQIYLGLILLCLHFVGHYIFVKYYSVQPFEGPIALNPAGKISNLIEIRMPQRYVMDLVFCREGHDLEKLNKLIGGVYIEERKGIIIPVKWSLKAVRTNEIVLQNQVQTQGAHGWSRKYVNRFIGNITVKPGAYNLEVEILQSIPELQGVDTRIQLAYITKNGTTWHSGYMWWGMIFNYFVAPFLIISLLCKLFQRTGWGRWSISWS
jgi:hypothetical protein